ncbi:uncharacterized protein [Chironomus tepperi]|uniref:uncharacterized protein n=1 Tax=Chironomus tepperi TaxID=113505 RepID=UPI00391F0508
MKCFIVIVCLVQIAFGAPAEQSIVDQTQQTIAKIQENAQAAVKQINTQLLEATGSSNNVDLLNRFQTGAETYAKNIKGVADQLSNQATESKQGVDAIIKSVATQLSESAANLLANNDQTKVTQLRSTFQNVIDQADSLNSRLQTEGTNIQSIFADTLSKLYENTLSAAKNVAQQIDAAQAPKTT